MERKNRLMMEPSEAQSLMKEKGLSKIADLLPLLVPSAQLIARPPISNFPVGAAGLGASGRIYLGCNLEFPGLPLHHSVHAEQFLVANASLHGETHLLSIAVSAAPCGHCRQFFQELRNPQNIQILVTSDPKPEFRQLIEFLPRPFGPVDLLDSDVPLLLEKHRNDNIHVDYFFSCNGGGNDGDDGRTERVLIDAAAEAARGAHAPYSGCASGFAVMDRAGRVFGGSYMESAAYNPSLGPVQAAMVGYVVGGGGGWEGIVGGALVEWEGAKVSHQGTARIFFETVAPMANLWVHRLRLRGVEDV